VLHELQLAAPDMQPDASLVGDITAGNVHEPTAYLLANGQVGIFGGIAESNQAYAETLKKAAEHFASSMHTDVAVQIKDVAHGGEIANLIIHPDGTNVLLEAPKGVQPLVETVVMKLGPA
jgi:hypothetical protein